MQDAICIIKRIDDFCPICKRNYALELYDSYGNKLNYFKLLNQNNLSNIDSKRNIIMKCRYCNGEVMINRIEHDRYIPLIPNTIKDDSYNKFMNDIETRKNKLYDTHKVIERKNSYEDNTI